MNYTLNIINHKEQISCSEDENILDCLERNNYAPPCSCRIGVCSACKTSLKEGSVNQEEQGCLTDEELDGNFILTCVSYLKSDASIFLDD